MTAKKLSIHTENLLPIIKKWLYADREVFLRELISNAHDAILKRKIAFGSDTPDTLSITVDKEAKTLTISDTGIGMSADEIERYIAQIAFSGAEEFAKKYQTEGSSIIGHFGLGFYSAYMVASKVDIHSLSFEPGAQGAFWSCDGGVDYTLEVREKQSPGTTLVLHMADDALEFLEESKIRSLLATYCTFLPIQIEVNGTPFETLAPLWLKTPSTVTREEYLEFYQKLYPMDEPPLFWVHLNIDYPFHVKGILYFPKMGSHYDFQKSHIRLYSNRVYVSDNCKDLLPDYLTVLKGAIDSPDIPLNVSRSYLQTDKTVRSLASHISKKVTQLLNDQFKSDRESFEKNFADIEMVIKLGLLQDEKLFEKVEPFYLLKTLKNSYQTLDEASGGKEEATLYYTQDAHLGAELLKLFDEKKIAVYLLNSPLDSAVLNLLEMKKKIKFSRIDGQLPEELLQESLISPEVLKPLFDGIELKVKAFDSPKIPGMFIIDESMRRFKEYMQLSRQEGYSGLDLPKELVLNSSSPLVQKLVEIKDSPEAKDLATWIFDLVSLSQHRLDPKNLARFIEQSSTLAGLAPTPA